MEVLVPSLVPLLSVFIFLLSFHNFLVLLQLENPSFIHVKISGSDKLFVHLVMRTLVDLKLLEAMHLWVRSSLFHNEACFGGRSSIIQLVPFQFLPPKGW